MIGGVKIINATIASGAVSSTSHDLSWANNVYLVIHTFPTAFNITPLISINNGSTYFELHHEPINSATVATNQFVISAAVASGGGVVHLPKGNYNYFKVVAAGAVVNGASFDIVITD